MSPYSLPAVLAFTVNFTLGLLVLLSNPRSGRNRWFAGLILAFSFWNLIEALIIVSPSEARARLLSFVLYRFIYLMPAFFFLFVVHIATPNRSKMRSPLTAALLVLPPALLLFISRTHFPIKPVLVDTQPLAYYYTVGFLDTPFAVLLTFSAFLYLGFALTYLLRCRGRTKTARQKRQITSILAGYPAFFLLFMVSWFVAPLRRSAAESYILGTSFTVLVSISLWVAGREYGLLRIRRLLAGGLAFTFFSALILAFYLLVLRTLSNVISTTFGIQSPLPDIVLVLALALVVRPAEYTVQRLLEQAFRRGIRSYRQALLELGEDLLEYRGRGYFVARTCRFLRTNLGVRSCAILLPGNHDNTHFQLWTEKGPDEVEYELPVPFQRRLTRLGRPLERGELDEFDVPRQLQDQLAKENAEILLPLLGRKRLLGLLYLGRKKSVGRLDEESLQMLTVLGNELSLALERNLLVEQVELREREQARVDRVDALRRLLAGVAHEIRNPLNTIATAADTISRQLDNPDTVREMANIISSETDRMDNLLADFLRLQRIRSPRAHRTNLRQIVERVVLGAQYGLSGLFQIDEDVAPTCESVVADGDLVEQILENLVKNAVESISNREPGAGTGRIRLRLRCDERKIRIVVEDNGNGIPGDLRNRIFEPFFTTKPEGTGLGLTIVHNIVHTLNGRIDVSSSDERTVFTVTLPLGGTSWESPRLQS